MRHLEVERGLAGLRLPANEGWHLAGAERTQAGHQTKRLQKVGFPLPVSPTDKLGPSRKISVQPFKITKIDCPDLQKAHFKDRFE